MTKYAFRFVFVWALCLLGSSHALAAPVAYVHELSGKLQAQYGTRAPQSLNVGGTIEPGATLSTGADSNAVVKFEDGQIVALQPDTQFTVRGYQFVKANVAKSNSFLELLTGGLRFVTGMIGATNRNAFKLTAGTATIGIRGTDGTVLFNRSTGEVNAATNLGALAVVTPLGTSTIPAGNYATAPRNAPPRAAAPITQAPPAVARVISRARAIVVPANTPVSVPASAQAAATKAQAATAERAAQAAQTAAERQAAEKAAQEARTAAEAAEKAAAQASEQTTQEAVQGGAVLPTPPAPPAAAPAEPAAAAETTTATAATETTPTTEQTPVAAEIEALPATAAGEPAAVAAEIGAFPATAAGEPAATVTTTPTATGSGSGGGGTASVR